MGSGKFEDEAVEGKLSLSQIATFPSLHITFEHSSA